MSSKALQVSSHLKVQDCNTGSYTVVQDMEFTAKSTFLCSEKNNNLCTKTQIPNCLVKHLHMYIALQM